MHCKKVHPEVVRLALLSSHYRQPLDFSDQLLIDMKTMLDRFYTALKHYEDVALKPFKAL